MSVKAGNVVEAVSEFLRRGYDHEYHLKERRLYDVTIAVPIEAYQFHVDASLRFESSPAGDDGSNLYAISERGKHTKGLLIDAFDEFDAKTSHELYDRLASTRRTAVENDDDLPRRYGLRKVSRADFDADPERFVLRMEFPDFPECPFGQSFSMLGFDTAAQQYVWLATSVLKDTRLIRVPFQDGDVPDNA